LSSLENFDRRVHLHPFLSKNLWIFRTLIDGCICSPFFLKHLDTLLEKGRKVFAHTLHTIKPSKNLPVDPAKAEAITSLVEQAQLKRSIWCKTVLKILLKMMFKVLQKMTNLAQLLMKILRNIPLPTRIPEPIHM
jgi:hypothetical protein